MSSRRSRTRSAVLTAAWKRLATPGDPARLEDIAADAGMTRQSIYLHFGTRAGLLVALVNHMDESLGLVERFEAIHACSDPVEALERTLRFAADYEPKIHGVAMALIRLAPSDPDAAVALADRMRLRHDSYLQVVRRVSANGKLARGWSIRRVADVLFTASSPESFEHLVIERSWSTKMFERWLLHLGRSFLSRGRTRAR